MRLLRLDFLDEFYSYELHPKVTVVSGAELDRLVKLARTVRSLGAGSVANVAGLVEHGGILVSLDGVSEQQLSGYGTKNDVVLYLGAGHASSSLLDRELQLLATKQEVAAIKLEEIRADLDHEAKAELFLLKQRLGMAEGSESALAGLSSPERRLALIQRFYSEAEKFPQTVRNIPHGVPELVESFKALEKKRQDQEESLKAQHELIEMLTSERTQARNAMEQASVDAKPVLLSYEEEQRLETLSDPSSDLSRKGKWRNQLTEDETSELQEMLKKVGVESPTEYKIFRLNPVAPRDLVDAAADARIEYETIVNRLKVERARLEADPGVAASKAQTEQLEAQAQQYLGTVLPSNIVEALEDLASDDPNPKWVSAVEELRRVLDDHGLAAPRDLEPNEVVEWTDSWLRGESSVTESHIDEDLDIDELKAQIAVAEKQFAKHSRAFDLIPDLNAEYAEAELLAKRLLDLKESIEGSSQVASTADVKALLKEATEAMRPAESAVPLLLVSDFEGIDDEQLVEFMDSTTDLSETAQIIVISDRSVLVDWANQVGLKAASVISPTLEVAAN